MLDAKDHQQRMDFPNRYLIINDGYNDWRVRILWNDDERITLTDNVNTKKLCAVDKHESERTFQ